jgi:hypothetical protein
MVLMRNVALLSVLLVTSACASTQESSSVESPGSRPVSTMGDSEPMPARQSPSGPAQVNDSRPGIVPVGQELDVRLQDALSSRTATAEQRFTATTAVDLMQGDRVIIPAGATVRGIVSTAEPAGRVDRTGRLTLAFDQITINGRSHPVRAMATQVFESAGIRDEARTVGTAGAVGAVVGGLIGGVKGAVIGAAVGSGGVIAATEGKDIELQPGTIVRIRLDQPLELRR